MEKVFSIINVLDLFCISKYMPRASICLRRCVGERKIKVKTNVIFNI
jgi:hypothetical protein